MMKKNRLICIGLILTLLLQVFPIVASADSQEEPAWTISYDNSLWYAVERADEHQFTPADFAELFVCDQVTTLAKEKTDNGYKYQLLLHFWKSGKKAMSDAGDILVQLGVGRVLPYFDAPDYVECASDVSFFRSAWYLRPGEEMDLSLNRFDLADRPQMAPGGVDVTIDPQQFSLSDFDRLGVKDYYANTADTVKKRTLYGRTYYYEVDLNNRLTESPIHNYFVPTTQKNYHQLLQAFSQTPGVISYVPVSFAVSYAAVMPSMSWRTDSDVITLTDQGRKTPLDPVRIKAEKEGKATVTFTYSAAGYPNMEATCTIYVRESDPTKWTYDNSFLVTMERPHGQSYDGSFPENFSGATVIQKTVGETVDTYRVVYTTPNTEAWESLQQQLLAMDGVLSVGRNRYASDYEKEASFITPNRSEIRLAVGETAQINVQDSFLAENDGPEVIGVEFQVNPNTFETIEANCFEEFGIGLFWAVPEDATYTNSSRPIYKDYYPETDDNWFDDSYKNAASTNHTYFGVLKDWEDIWQRGTYLSQFRMMLQALGTDMRIGSVQPIYRQSYPTGARPYEWWEMTDSSIAQITAMVNTEDQPDWWSEEPSANPADHQECFFHKHLVTVKGMQAGNTVLKVTVGYLNSHTVEIPVTVYSPDGAYKKGDVSGNARLEAADALLILQSVVGKITLNEQAATAADMNGDGVITPVDALAVLRSLVGKPAV